MSGRLIITPHNAELVLGSTIKAYEPIHTSFNLTPKSRPAIIMQEGTQLIQKQAFWSFTPEWLKDLNQAPYLLRADKLSTSPMYKTSFSSQRCILIISGYYVWLELSRGKHPFAIRLPQNKPFMVAGLWTNYPVAPNDNYLTFGLVSVAADPWLARLTERIPLKLQPQEALEWLNPTTSPKRIKQLLTTEDKELEAYPISKLVNNPANQSDQVVRPIAAKLIRNLN